MLRRVPVPGALAGLLVAVSLAQVVGQRLGLAVGAAAVVGGAVVAFAGRRPLLAVATSATSATTQAALTGDDPVFGTFLALIAGFVALGRRGSQGELAAGAGCAAAAVAALLLLDEGGSSPVEVVFPLAYFGGAAALGRLARSRERQAAALLAATQREAEAREAAALAEERARIARDMHDVVAHSVSLLVVQAESAAAVLPTDPARAGAQLERVTDSGRQAMDELRRLLGVLRDDTTTSVRPQPGLADLAALAASVRDSGTDVVLVTGDGLDEVPAGVQLTAYRVVQEGLTNAVRHGRARRVEVRVERRGDELAVEVLDDGAGGSVGSVPGHGLAGMRERLRAYGGRLDVGPLSGGGWRVLAVVPVTP